MNFSYWDTVDPAKFLSDDWGNPSRAWAASQIADAVKRGASSMVEIGPGRGVDYAWLISKLPIAYSGWEGSRGLFEFLVRKYPDGKWECRPLLDLPAKSFDLVYARHVLEHQPNLEPSLSTLLAAARMAVVIVWYRPPDETGLREYSEVERVHYNTYRRDEVLSIVAANGWRVAAEVMFEPSPSNLGWVLVPSAESR